MVNPRCSVIFGCFGFDICLFPLFYLIWKLSCTAGTSMLTKALNRNYCTIYWAWGLYLDMAKVPISSIGILWFNCHLICSLRLLRRIDSKKTDLHPGVYPLSTFLKPTFIFLKGCWVCGSSEWCLSKPRQHMARPYESLRGRFTEVRKHSTVV